MRSVRDFFESLFSLQYHDELNPKLWIGDELRPEVRAKLLEIARAWLQYAGISESDTHEIVLTGGNANYNYSDFSDIDIHIAVDSAKVVPVQPERAAEFFFDKYRLWANRYPNIRVRGYSVEIYAHDVDELFPAQQGVYSLVNDAWIQKPSHDPIDYEGDQNLKVKVDHYARLIKQLTSTDGSTEAIRDLKTKFFQGRTAGIAAEGERSVENLAYKELRNRGLIAALNDYIEHEHEKNLSLESKN